MTASISAHSTNIASTIIHAYHYNLSLCMCHVQPTVYQRNSYYIHDIHVTEAICSCTPISRAPLIYGIPFTHADILIFSCDLATFLLRCVHEATKRWPSDKVKENCGTNLKVHCVMQLQLSLSFKY